MDLTPFAGSTNDEAETYDLRTNPLQEGGDDVRGPNSRLITRAIVRRIEEDWDFATEGKDILLYMFKKAIT